MRSAEWVAVIYCAVLAASAAAQATLPAARRIAIVSGAAIVSALAILVANADAPAIRSWAPIAYIGAGYFLSGLFFVAPSERFERWLRRWDDRLLGDPTTRFAHWPGFVLAYLESVYVVCFLVLPAGYAVLVWTGRAGDANRYWTLVEAAELGSFVSLAFVQARPPWLVERPAVLPATHGLGSFWVRTFTIQVNTFPSGHVAGSLAVALGLLGTSPLTFGIFLVIAVSIAVACIVGRYHYLADILAGIVLALAIWAAGLAVAV
jgi:membrane-associated phospholipid phosphatase